MYQYIKRNLCKVLGMKYQLPKSKTFFHLCTQEHKAILEGNNGSETPVTIFIHYYENERGERKFTLGSNHSELKLDKISQYIQSTQDYHCKIVPWLSGRYMSDVPRYEDIPAEDLKRILKKRV